LKEVE